MRSLRLYSVAAPLMLLPLMDFSVSQIPAYFKGLEFRTFLAEILSQIAGGVVDALIVGGVQGFLGVTG